MKKNLIIQSIGTANPSIAKILADSFGINHELLIKQLYNAPTIFLEKAEDEIVQKTASILSELGLEVEIKDENTPLPTKSEPVDVAIYISNPLEMGKVSKQLAEFLGCKENESLSLLLNEPSVVLGNVSMATAEVLKNRIDAEVIASSPQKDLYTIEISDDKTLRKEIQLYLKNNSVRFKDNNWIEDISYAKAQELWNRYHQTKKIKIYNQSYQRFEILLNKFDINDSQQTDFLTTQIGMPQEALQTILENLPVVLDESLNKNEAASKMELYSSNGLSCSFKPIPFGKYKLEVSNIRDSEKFQQIVSQFYKDTKIKKEKNKWIAPNPLDSLLNRYLEKKLEYIGCEINHIYETK